MQSHNTVGWFEIYVNDMERARNFYQTVFALELEQMDMPEGMKSAGLEMWTFPADMETERYGAPGALVYMPETPGFNVGPGGTIVYFMSQDCAVEAARVAEAGGTLIQDKMAIGEHGFIAMVQDSEGNMIGIHSDA